MILAGIVLSPAVGFAADIAEVGPNESSEIGYDTQSGDLVMLRNSLRLLPGTSQVTEMQVARRP